MDIPDSYNLNYREKRAKIAEFSEIFGEVMDWPVYFKILIFCEVMSYINRAKVVCFAYKNGFNIETLLSLIRACNPNPLTVQQAEKMIFLYNVFDRDDEVGMRYRSRYSSYDLYNKRIEYLNGVPKYGVNYNEYPDMDLLCILNLIELDLYRLL